MTVKCFMVRPVEEAEAWLRRYAGERGGRCPDMPGEHSYHDASVHIGRVPERYDSHGDRRTLVGPTVEEFSDDERWRGIETCSCGYAFDPGDRYQVLTRQLWEADGGERRILDAFGDDTDVAVWGPGAMFDAWWLPRKPVWCGPDGLALHVICPDGHQWNIDGRASNCDRPGADHDCWCRHGLVPLIRVDKNPEPGRSTCSAGGGSIAAPGYHGFLGSGGAGPGEFTASL